MYQQVSTMYMQATHLLVNKSFYFSISSILKGLTTLTAFLQEEKIQTFLINKNEIMILFCILIPLRILWGLQGACIRNSDECILSFSSQEQNSINKINNKVVSLHCMTHRHKWHKFSLRCPWGKRIQSWVCLSVYKWEFNLGMSKVMSRTHERFNKSHN